MKESAHLIQHDGRFPHAISFLMDQQTLLDHKPFWVEEPQPESATLVRLTSEESILYDQLRQDHWGVRVRLEQERIGFAVLLEVLRKWLIRPT